MVDLVLHTAVWGQKSYYIQSTGLSHIPTYMIDHTQLFYNYYLWAEGVKVGVFLWWTLNLFYDARVVFKKSAAFHMYDFMAF